MAEIEGGSPVAELVAALVAARAARVLAGAPGPTAAVFSGATGAGKTTTIRLVAQALAARGFSVATVPERLPAHLFAKYLADPAAHARLFPAALAHPPPPRPPRPAPPRRAPRVRRRVRRDHGLRRDVLSRAVRAVRQRAHDVRARVRAHEPARPPRRARRRRMRGAGASSPLTTARTARCTCPRVK